MCLPGWGRARAAAYRLDRLARLRRVRDRIAREYRQPLDVAALARSAGMTTGELSREFRLAYGETPHAHLVRCRAERARALPPHGAAGPVAGAAPGPAHGPAPAAGTVPGAVPAEPVRNREARAA